MKPNDAAALADAELLENIPDWIDAIDDIRRNYGDQAVRIILHRLQDHIIAKGVPVNEATLNTPYINTIAPSQQPVYPGNCAIETRIENIIRWNAMAMVLQAQDQGTGVGGHIATYASAATALEVGFNHFFRNRSKNYGGDLVMPQPHAAPGVYARAFMEGRLTERHLRHFRRQLAPGGGLSSYPHPRSLPDFWQVPNASMGLSTATAIYQARFAKYLENRGLKPANGGKVWCFIGDGESDEPEVRGTINIAARENLDNLILVINCNLQRLDGPVRGNGKIIQELERSFRGSDWNVIKVIWGTGWDGLLAQDHQGFLRKRMEEAVDGDYQYYSVSSGNIQREHWVEDNPELVKMMNSLTDDEIKQIKRGGQDPKKIYAAYKQASESEGKPTVVLLKTVKGDGMGSAAQGKNSAHQKKNLSAQERMDCAINLGIPLTPEEQKKARFYLPPQDSEEMRYVQARREALGGFLPSRSVACPTLLAPPLSLFKEAITGSGTRQTSTTSVMVRMLAKLLKDKTLGQYIVPIVPDEARTFGMDGLFAAAGIYSATGQQYTPVDAESLTPYKEAVDGQILQEGICETGAIASFLAAGTAYAVHGVPTIPFYIFYSMFGFQRVGDMIWSCGDMLARGFLLGGTAGRTTLNGEGLQHQDGHSHILASTVPNLKSYDPAYGYELAVIVRDGIRRMYQDKEAIFYYLTLYNENHTMPVLPEQEAIEEAIVNGAYCLKRSDSSVEKTNRCVHLLASGIIVQQALQAADKLESLGIATHVWSVTSFNELYRSAVGTERWNRLHPLEAPRESYIGQLFNKEEGVFVAVSDYMKSYVDCIARWLPRPNRFVALGTDGYGVSESREQLRDYFEVSAEHIVASSLHVLYTDNTITQTVLTAAMDQLSINPEKLNPAKQ